jgi:BirA family transcriptional regulator, biotin operon repressor / biotin---[acetyl-CoA-carboxylase] ligase
VLFQKPVLNQEQPGMQLPRELIEAGDRLFVFDSIDSTMDEARRQSAVPGQERRWIVARTQHAGRGRQGKLWTTEAGNLAMTLLLPAPCALQHQPKLGFVAGVALAQAARQCLGDKAAIALKWPNDLLLSNAKVSGLLLEGLGNGASIGIGIGVNVVSHPVETPYPATHLRTVSQTVTAERLFAALSLSLVDQLQAFGDGAGFPLIRSCWLAWSAHLGKQIVVRSPQGAIAGRFQDIDAEGRLMLDTHEGLLRIDAGDVFVLDK